ncbi:HNH endonuclease [Kocuria sp. LUK]|uniref:HNH endonuclease signature motif containing protein n=1 Tax=Kocuria sp. LUK TaxID=2897828 RepID=UPI001E391DD2|nr:HNH endonuclease signature motif containing protein [Kocuria sp. LUK]MCD1143682.1 HNH endonuclease [Kocuria sp. LUK]
MTESVRLRAPDPELRPGFRAGAPGPAHVEDFPRPEDGAGDHRQEIRTAAAQLVEARASESRAVAAQVRSIHRLWSAAQAVRTAARFAALAEAETSTGSARPDPLGPLAEAEHELVLDVAAEVGAALQLPPGTARRRVEDAVLLAEMLPEVLTALEEGRIGPPQAAVLVEQWRELVVEAPTWTARERVPPPVDAVLRLVSELLERAPRATAAQLRAAARSRRAVLVADAEERSRRAARKNRSVWVEPAPDGTAYLHALLDAHVALAAHDRLEELASRLGERVPAPGRPGPGRLARPELPEDAEPRSAGELRADVLADLLLDGVLPEEPDFPRGVRARVSVLVPVSVLADAAAGASAAAGSGTGAPVLSGYGPIGAGVARRLAAGAGAWHRILTHPGTGVVLDHDRTVYAVPRDLRRLVELRDGTCRFPGCRRRAERCDLDHTVAWQDGGTTAEHNLAVLCRHHHRLKHRDGPLGRWSVRRVAVPPGPRPHRGPPGAGPEPGATAVLEWVSPAGLVHRTEPEHAVCHRSSGHPAIPEGAGDTGQAAESWAAQATAGSPRGPGDVAPAAAPGDRLPRHAAAAAPPPAEQNATCPPTGPPGHSPDDPPPF